jgi:hypothetical protein
VNVDLSYIGSGRYFQGELTSYRFPFIVDQGSGFEDDLSTKLRITGFRSCKIKRAGKFLYQELKVSDVRS